MIRVDYQYDDQGNLIGTNRRFIAEKPRKSRKSIFCDEQVGLCHSTLLYEDKNWLFESKPIKKGLGAKC